MTHLKSTQKVPFYVIYFLADSVMDLWWNDSSSGRRVKEAPHMH